jgi:hypothetical protein
MRSLERLAAEWYNLWRAFKVAAIPGDARERTIPSGRGREALGRIRD